MKKIVTIFLLLVYGFSSTGTTVHLHYCCGKLDNISLSSTQTQACHTKAVSKHGCCDNKHLELKLHSDQEPTAKWISTPKELTAAVSTPVCQVVVPAQDTPVNEYATGPPERASSVPLFIQHSSYLI